MTSGKYDYDNIHGYHADTQDISQYSYQPSLQFAQNTNISRLCHKTHNIQ